MDTTDTTFQPLTPEQFQSARQAGFSPDKIIQMEQIRKSQSAPNVAQQRAQAIAQGQPVSVNPNKVHPSLVGSFIRGVAKVPIQAAESVIAGVTAPFTRQTGNENNNKGGYTTNSNYLGDVSDYLTSMKPQQANLRNKLNTGQISPGRAVLGTLGVAAQPSLDLASFIPGAGVAETAAKQLVKGQVEKTALKQALKTSLIRGGGYAGTYDVAGQLASGEKYKPLQTLESIGTGAGLDLGISHVLPAVVGGAKGTIKGTKKIFSAQTPEKIISKAEKDIYDIENNYAKTRKANDYSKDAGSASRKRIAQSNVLVNSVDENGLVRTKQAIQKYKAQNIDGTEGTVRENLARLGEKVHLNDVEQQLTKSVHESGLEGSDLRTALNNVKKEISGYRLKADAEGKIPLTLVHDAKISTTRNIDFNTPAESKTYRKAIARGLKETVENNSSFNVKEVNAELSKFYDDIERLKRLDGARVKGGKLGKYFAQTVGNITGGLAGGAVGGPVGSAAGTVIGGEVASKIKGSMMSRVFGKGTGKLIPKSKILQEASDLGKSPRLMLPAPKEGQPRTQLFSGKTINLPKQSQSSIDEAYRSRSGTQKSQYTANPTAKPKSIPMSKIIPQPKPKSKLPLQPFAKQDKALLENLTPRQKDAFSKGTPQEQQTALEHLRLKNNVENNPSNFGVQSTIKDPLTKEAQKYKSAEEFVKKYQDTMDSVHKYAGGNSVLFRKNVDTVLQGKLMDYLSSPEVLAKYKQGLHDPQILTDFYNKVKGGEAPKTKLGRLLPTKLKATYYDTPAIIKARAEQSKLISTHTINTPERVALRKNVFETLDKNGGVANASESNPVKQGKQAHIIIGSPASGKSKLFADPIRKKISARLLDSDEAKKMLGDIKYSGSLHEESDAIMLNLMEKSMDKGDNLVIPIVGKTESKVKAFIDVLHSKGYDVHLNYSHIEPDEAARRAIDRFNKTGKFVDPNYVLNEVGLKPKATYDKLKSYEKVKSYQSHSVQERSKPPQFIEKGGIS